jgi:hypothetical protein
MGEGRTSGNRVSVYDAARVMSITVDAIRKRISRGTIPHERDEEGRVWVILDTDQGAASKVQDADQPQSDATALISAKDETIATLRDQLEAERHAHAKAKRLLMAALERIPPQVEAPSEARESHQTADEQQGRGEPRPATVESQESIQRP